MDIIPCPKCGCSFHVPTAYDNAEMGKQHRGCTCDYAPEPTCGGSITMDHISQKLNEHGRLLQILMRCFQRNPDASPPAAHWADLKIDVSRIPEPMKERAIKRFKAANPAVDANLVVCKYCGDSYGGSAAADSGITIIGVFTCYECEEVRKFDLRTFSFITRIFQWIYGEAEPAPQVVLPIPTPEPEPKPEPKNERNIVL